MTELESLQQLFKGVKDTDYIVKRVLEYKSEFEVCEDCIHFDAKWIECNNLSGLSVALDFGCNELKDKQ
jgi:hypothetical protein